MLSVGQASALTNRPICSGGDNPTAFFFFFSPVTQDLFVISNVIQSGGIGAEVSVRQEGGGWRQVPFVLPAVNASYAYGVMLSTTDYNACG